MADSVKDFAHSFQIGDPVDVHNLDGGVFAGHVRSFKDDRSAMFIWPDEPAMQKWYPKGYDLGSAHWGTVATYALDRAAMEQSGNATGTAAIPLRREMHDPAQD